MKVIQIDQRTDAWHDWRAAKGEFALADGGPRITATMLNAIMGVSPYQTPYGLWLELTGRKAKQVTNWAMQRGQNFEEPARIAYESCTGDMVEPLCIESSQVDFAAASLDGLSAFGDVLVEIKVPGQADIALVRDHQQVPSKYLPQVQWQLMCAGPEVQSLDFYVYSPELAQGWSVRVGHDSEYQSKLLQKAKEFRACVMEDRPPAGVEFASLGADYLAAKIEADAAAERADRLKKSLIAALQNSGETRLESPCVTVTCVTSKGRTDAKKFRSKLVEITGKTEAELTALEDECRGSETTSVRLTEPKDPVAALNSFRSIVPDPVVSEIVESPTTVCLDW